MTTKTNLSRRALLGGAAVTGSALALEACGGDPVPAPVRNADIDPLNSLLAAEYGAIAAYDAGIPILEMPPTGDPQAASGIVLATIARAWQSQHRDHAAQLSATITGIGGTPVANTAVFTAPPGFARSVRNVMVLACNAEKDAAVAYNQAVKTMGGTATRYLAANIEGAETQHFVILYTLLQQVVAPNNANLVSMINEIAPKAYVANVGTMPNGLTAIADFMYTA